jgi:hypothetical protein
LREARFGDGRTIPSDLFDLRASVIYDPIRRCEYNPDPGQNWLRVTYKLRYDMLGRFKTVIQQNRYSGLDDKGQSG